MNLSEYLDHPTLSRFVKTVPAGTFLFSQGEQAERFYIILDGRVALLQERDDGEHVVSFIEPGEFLGERVITSERTYPRTHSARAESETSFIELPYEEIKRFERVDPETMAILFRHTLKSLSDRFERMRFLVRCLRPTHEIERFVNLVLYFCSCSGTKFPAGTLVQLSPQSITAYIEIPVASVEYLLRALTQRKLIVELSPDTYFVPNESLLTESIPDLIQSLAIDVKHKSAA